MSVYYNIFVLIVTFYPKLRLKNMRHLFNCITGLIVGLVICHLFPVYIINVGVHTAMNLAAGIMSMYILEIVFNSILNKQ